MSSSRVSTARRRAEVAHRLHGTGAVARYPRPPLPRAGVRVPRPFSVRLRNLREAFEDLNCVSPEGGSEGRALLAQGQCVQLFSELLECAGWSCPGVEALRWTRIIEERRLIGTGDGAPGARQREFPFQADLPRDVRHPMSAVGRDQPRHTSACSVSKGSGSRHSTMRPD